jgi:hypothetical protein
MNARGLQKTSSNTTFSLLMNSVANALSRADDIETNPEEAQR